MEQLIGNGRCKVVLQVPNLQERGWDFDITDYHHLNKWDRSDLLMGRELAEEVLVLSPEQVAFENDTGLEMECVPLEIGVVISTAEYHRLAGHLKIVISLAWRKLKQGRLVKRVFDREWALFLLTLEPGDPEKLRGASRGIDVAKMEDALAETGVGRVVTDNYEIKRLRDMTENFGETLHA
jgi:hypothetical protein